jgi:predicted dehydrogenase
VSIMDTVVNLASILLFSHETLRLFLVILRVAHVAALAACSPGILGSLCGLMKQFRVGVAGVGAIGRNHARVLAGLFPDSPVVIYDANVEHAARIAQEFGGQAVKSVEELISRTDAVTVATPTSSHFEIGCQLLEAGKHVLIEKPITDDTNQARALIELAVSKRCVLQVGHIERFNPVLSLLEERMHQPIFIEAHRLSPFPNRSIDIGVVLDLMIHDLEIILHLVKSEIVNIDAVGVPVLTRREDIANARLRFANGCVANITASRISPEKMRKIRVFQGDCYLSLDYQEQQGKIFRREGGMIHQEEVTVEKDEPLKLELAAFVECARLGATPKVSGQQGADALAVALEITRLIEAASVG